MSNTRIHLTTTVSYPTMNLAINLEEEAKALKSDEYKTYFKKASHAKLMQTINGRPFQPVFSADHFIKPQPVLAHAG